MILEPAFSLSGPPARPCRPAVSRYADRYRLREYAADRRDPCAPTSSSERSIDSARGSFSTPSRVKTRTSITVPSMPGGTRSDVSLTSDAFSPKIALSSFSSGVSCVSPFGVTLPTRMSPALTSAPMNAMPDSSSLVSAASPTFGISAGTSSGPSLVSRATHVSSSI